MPFTLPDRDLFATLTESRRLVSELLSVRPEEIALTVNTGFGLSMAARALPLKPGDVVLVSDREFPANVYPWMRLREQGVEMELVPTTAEGWPDEARLLERLLGPQGAAVGRSPWFNSAPDTSPISRRSPRPPGAPGRISWWMPFRPWGRFRSICGARR